MFGKLHVTKRNDVRTLRSQQKSCDNFSNKLSVNNPKHFPQKPNASKEEECFHDVELTFCLVGINFAAERADINEVSVSAEVLRGVRGGEEGEEEVQHPGPPQHEEISPQTRKLFDFARERKQRKRNPLNFSLYGIFEIIIYFFILLH
jgi:hypothetical protein